MSEAYRAYIERYIDDGILFVGTTEKSVSFTEISTGMHAVKEDMLLIHRTSAAAHKSHVGEMMMAWPWLQLGSYF